MKSIIGLSLMGLSLFISLSVSVGIGMAIGVMGLLMSFIVGVLLMVTDN